LGQFQLITKTVSTIFRTHGEHVGMQACFSIFETGKAKNKTCKSFLVERAYQHPSDFDHRDERQRGEDFTVFNPPDLFLESFDSEHLRYLSNVAELQR